MTVYRNQNKKVNGQGLKESSAELVDFSADCWSPSAVTKVFGRKVIAECVEEIPGSKVRVAMVPSPCLALSEAVLERA